MDTCGNCNSYTGEECNYGPCEGSEKYDDSEACDFFEPIEGAKNTEQPLQLHGQATKLPLEGFMQKELLPCPFCGGEAHFDHDDFGWEWVECGQCHVASNMRTSIAEDCKIKLAEGWNQRTNGNIQQQVQADSSSTPNSLT